MTSNPVAPIEKTSLVLAVVAVALAGGLWGASGSIAAGAGAGLACANLWVIRKMAARALGRAALGDTAGTAGKVAGVLIAKMTALFALVWVAVGVFDLAILPFALGLSVLVISLLSSGLWLGLKEAA